MKSILTIMFVVLVVLAGIWFVRDNAAESDRDTQETRNNNSGSNNQPRPSSSDNNGDSDSSLDEEDMPTSGDDVPVVEEEIPNGMRGELRSSNDSSRGNLMLLLADSDRIIYLNTARDYSSLIGKDVLVTIDGSQDDFRLVDIQEAGN